MVYTFKNKGSAPFLEDVLFAHRYNRQEEGVMIDYEYNLSTGHALKTEIGESYALKSPQMTTQD